MNPGQDFNYHAKACFFRLTPEFLPVLGSYMGNLSSYWELYGVFNPYILIDDQGYDDNNKNDIMDQTDKGIGVRQLWALRAWWIDYKIDDDDEHLIKHFILILLAFIIVKILFRKILLLAIFWLVF